MAGQYRTGAWRHKFASKVVAGKSSLLNWLLTGEPERSEAGFAVGHEVQRCTRGIWMWGRPLATRSADGGRAAVVLLDTEGFGGLGDVDDAYDTTVFALAALLASTLVYNSLGTLDERAIGALGFCARLSRRVRTQRGGEDDDEAATRAALRRGAPHFVWVLRDFALELSDETGAAETADEYLERSLLPKGKRESDEARTAIATYFPERKCWCLPRPFAGEGERARPRPEFWRAFEAFRESLLFGEHCVVKSLEGAAVRGSTLAALCREYAKAFVESRPTITGAWRAAIEGELRTAQRAAVEAHRTALFASSDDVATRHARGCRLADDATRGAFALGGSRGLSAAVDAAVAAVRRDCDGCLARYRDEEAKRREAGLKRRLAELEAEVLRPAIEKTRRAFALAEDPKPAGAYESFDDAEGRLVRDMDRILGAADEDFKNGGEARRDDDEEATKLARRAARFAAIASFDAARAVAETAADRRDAALALCEQQKRDLESRVSYLEGQDKAMRDSVDEHRRRTHADFAEALASKTRLEALEVALRAERTRTAELADELDKARAELDDAASALEDEERWQRELQERLDLRIKLSQEREDDLARRLERAQRKRKYTVLDFLLDNPDDAADKLQIDTDKLEKFLADINLPAILPALKQLGAARVSDLVYLEEADLDDITDIDTVQKRRLMEAVDAAKAEYRSSASAGRCVVS